MSEDATAGGGRLWRWAVTVLAALIATVGAVVPTAWADHGIDEYSVWYYGPDPFWETGSHTAHGGQVIAPFAGPNNPVYVQFVTAQPYQGGNEPWVSARLLEVTMTVDGINGASVAAGTGGFSIRCDTPDVDGWGCSVPAQRYTLTLTWRAMAESGSCMRAALYGNPPTMPNCPENQITGVATRTVVAAGVVVPPDPGLNVDFEWAVTDAGRREVTFTNLSTDTQDGTDLDYEWDFGDGATSQQANPVHVFATGGQHQVRLTAIDSDGNDRSVTKPVTLETPLVVNSTGDAGAVDAAGRGCDTGELVGGETECTLRAAIEAANAREGGEITFAIAGGGTPVIAPATELPVLTVSTTVDGTSQPGGFVELRGGSATNGLILNGGTSRVTGLVFDQFVGYGLGLGAGTGHVAEGNRFGTDATGTVAGTIFIGVAAVDSPSVRIADNTFGRCITCIQATRSTGAVIERNSLGVGPGGEAFGISGLAIAVEGAPGTVNDNVIRSGELAVLVLGAEATGSQVTGNRIGVGRDGAGFASAGAGIRIDGAPGVTVSGNVVTGQAPGILVSGSVQSNPDSTGFHPRSPDDVQPGPVTGGGTVIRNNTVGVLGDGTTASENVSSRGVLTWAGASNVTIEGNTVAHQTTSGIELRGGTGHVARTNVVRGGTEGILVQDTTAARVENNEVEASRAGVSLVGSAFGTTVSGNTIRGGEHGGVLIDAEGVSSTTIEDNTILAAGTGIYTNGAGTTITGNRIGISTSGTIAGNTSGIVAVRDVTVTRNVVVASAQDGIRVGGSATGVLRGNAVYGTGQLPISVANGPSAPEITAAIRTSNEGTDRTVLLVAGLPVEEGGIVEVFANADCSEAEAQARHVLDVTATKQPGRGYAIVPVLGQGNRDAFTVTYTSPTSGTSALSNCEARATYPDRDGDGTVDPVEDLVGTADNAQRAAVITDTGAVVLLETAAGTLAEVAVVDDPAPGAHPEGFTLPHGVFDFEVRGLDLGATTSVRMVVVDGATPIQGDSYWKYGPASTGASPSWYRFDVDTATGTGAVLDTVDLGDLGFRRAWVLTMTDGGRGDEDGFTDGVISDPGGPAIAGGDAGPGPGSGGGGSGGGDSGSGSGSGAPGGSGPAPGGPIDLAVCVPPPASPFPETGGSVHEEAIACLALLGVVEGFRDGTFGPGLTMTRGQLATVLVRILAGRGILPAHAPDAFDDDGASVHAGNIDLLAALGVIEGYGDRTVGPADPVTRGQAVSLLLRALTLAHVDVPSGAPDAFDDGAIHARALNAAAWLGLVRGFGDGTVRPGEPMTRGQIASLLYHALARIPDPA